MNMSKFSRDKVFAECVLVTWLLCTTCFSLAGISLDACVPLNTLVMSDNFVDYSYHLQNISNKFKRYCI